MKLGILFSGGKDSTYAAWLVKKKGHEIGCLITIHSKNQDSFMFHTPAIQLTKRQAELMGIPLLVEVTLGEKEKELEDLERAIEKAKTQYGIEGIVTGALASNYQASRILEICRKLGLECVNPLWHKDQVELLRELVKNNFEIIISAVAAFPLDKKWVGRKIDEKFIHEVAHLQKMHQLNPAGEGGEFESLVVNCPLFNKKLGAHLVEVSGERHAWRGHFK